MITKEVLIVEDRGAYRDSIKRAFRKEEGYVFYEASTVEEGISILEQKPSVRVIILDLLFPDKPGVELLEWIKPRASEYRVIIHTGHERLLTAEIARGYGAFYYQAKGADFSVQSIRFAVDQAFNNIESELLKEQSKSLQKKIGKHLEIQEKINANDNLNEILESICKAVQELVGGYTCHLRLFDLKKGDYILAGYDGPPLIREIFASPRKLDEYYSGRVARDNKPHLTADLQDEPEFQQLKERTHSADWFSPEAEKYLKTVRAAYIVPLSTEVFENDVDAVFNINSSERGFFTPDKTKIVDDFVSQANMAIAKDWLRNKRKEVHQDYSLSSDLLVKISEQLKGVNILENIYRIVIDGIVEIINPEMISIFIYNERTELLEKVAERISENITLELDETYGSGKSLTGKVYESGEIKRSNSPMQDPDYDETRREIDLQKLPSNQISHYLGVPLRTGEKTIGVIRVVNKKSGYYDELGQKNVRDDETCLLERGFSQDCETVLSIIASHLSVAIKNAHLINKLSGRIEQLQALTQVARRVSSNYEMEVDKLLNLIVNKTAEVTNSAICMLFLKDEYEGKTVVLEQAYGIPESRWEGISYALGEGKTGEVAETGVSKLEIQADESHVGKYDDLIVEMLRDAEGARATIESFMAVPIIVDESQVNGREIIGVLKVINKKQDHLPFDKDDVKVFETFASQIALAVTLAGRSYALSQLVGGVCHEINNTAPAIPVFVNKIRELLGPLGPDVEKRLSNIYVLAKQMVEFSNDLLGFSEIRMKEREPCDINLLVEKALEHFSPDTINIDNYNRVEVLRCLSDRPILCAVNDTPLIHIIRNIITNAYHAMEKRGEGQLEIKTYVDPSGRIAHMDFTDNGHGIERKYLSMIFRSDFSTKAGLKRNGLGLWLVKTYLRRMGGDISVASEYGHGAIFTIRIPTLKHGELADG